MTFSTKKKRGSKDKDVFYTKDKPSFTTKRAIIISPSGCIKKPKVAVYRWTEGRIYLLAPGENASSLYLSYTNLLYIVSFFFEFAVLCSALKDIKRFSLSRIRFCKFAKNGLYMYM